LYFGKNRGRGLLRGAVRLWGLALLVAGVLLLGRGMAQEGPILAVLEIDGAIGPATVDYVDRSFTKALDQGAEVIVLRMDTPGGLADSMRSIIRRILASPVPVVTFVAPRGAHAASAGTYILYASHVAAMSPGTNLGAATPVQIGGGGFPGAPQPEEEPVDDAANGENGEPARTRPARTAGMEDKIVNDAVAYIRSLAELRDRNAEWAERAVREAASLSAGAALAENVIELIATDLDHLIAQLDGYTVTIGGEERTLATADLEVVVFERDWRTELLSIITNPNVAYILMLVGIYGIIFEFYSPGLVFPGVVGVISLLLALYAFQVLPVNYAGLALIALGIAMMIAELLMPSFGALGVGGIIAFVVGSIMLMDTDVPGFGISWEVVGGVALTAGLLLMLMMTMVARSHRSEVVSGKEQMIGSTARVLAWDGGSGKVRIHGETWNARGPTGLAPGQTVRVTAIQDLELEVTPQS
jgi:membrane-bound serine protease (ClpP class)